MKYEELKRDYREIAENRKEKYSQGEVRRALRYTELVYEAELDKEMEAKHG